MATISVSLNDQQKKLIDLISKEEGVTRSEVVQRLLRQASWERTWEDMASQLRRKFDGLDLNSVDDIEKYLG